MPEFGSNQAALSKLPQNSRWPHVYLAVPTRCAKYKRAFDRHFDNAGAAASCCAHRGAYILPYDRPLVWSKHLGSAPMTPAPSRETCVDNW